MSRVADHAYSHCLAVLCDPADAAEAAGVAVRHGGRSRWVVLAHARHQALRRAADAAPDAAAPAGDDLLGFARALATTRPPAERALLDLADRHDLDRGGLGRVWGSPPADVADEVTTVAEVWRRELDPVLLAWLGPGECDDLATLLATHLSLWEAAPQVRAHVADCEVCGDRLRAMVSVRTALATAPLEHAPPGVAATNRRRRRRPLPGPATATRRPRRAASIAGAASVLVLGLIGLVVVTASDDDERDPVEILTAAPAGGSGALELEPNRISGHPRAPVSLRNTSGRTVAWTAQAKDFLVLTPVSGELGARDQAEIHVALGANAPEGELRATVTFSGDDGSSVALQIETVVERPPDIDAQAEACTVTASVEDEAELVSVVLHWRSAPDEPDAPMVQRDDDVWTGLLPSSANPIEWWVSAVDQRGNEAATASRPLDPFCGRT